jgi:hypothetical protein
MVNILKDGCAICDEFVSFGSTGVLGKNYDDKFTVENDKGYNTIGIRVDAPTGGTVQFEGTFDNINWEPITLRSIDDDTYTQTTINGSSFIGSVASLRAFRIRTIVAGTAPGTVRGRASVGVAVSEGQEFGWPPHKFGYPTVHKDKTFSAKLTNEAVWTPAAGKKVVITDVTMNVSGTNDGTISLFLNSDAEGSRLFRGSVNVTINKQFLYNHTYKVPFESQTAGHAVKMTTSAAMDIDLMLHGYEV